MRGNISNPEKKNKNIDFKEPRKESLKKKLFKFNKENSNKKDFPEDSIRIGKNAKTQIREYRRNRINNFSIDNNNTTNNNNSNNNIDLLKYFGKGIAILKSPKQTPFSREDIDPWLFFHNSNEQKNKTKLMKSPKNKKVIRDSFKV